MEYKIADLLVLLENAHTAAGILLRNELGRLKRSGATRVLLLPTDKPS